MKAISKFLLFSLAFFMVAFTSGDFFSFSLKDLDNKVFSFEEFKQNKATVVVFLLSDCPACQNYILTLNKMAEKYSKDSIDFIGVFPGEYSTDEELISFRKEYSVKFKLVKDPGKELVRFLHATISPQCFVVGADSEIVYYGRIDNWMFAVGKKRTTITENNLHDALESVIAGTPVKVKSTRAVGCIIE